LALAVAADGLHIGQRDTEALAARHRLGEKAILGVSVGSPEEARAAEAAGASYLAASPVFATPTKPDAPEPVGLEGLRAIRAVTELPLVAIGGVSETNAAALLEAGADMLCAISASLADGKVEENIQRLLIAAGFRGER
jgi:thiamine-phosphate pyrophosphorylase